MIKLMVFLGNPGNQYKLTRHNYAWRLLDRLDLPPGGNWQKKYKGSFMQIPGQSGKVGLLKPETYMNKSGESVAAASSFFKIKPHEVVVVHDDIEMPFGAWGLKKGGGLGGHNGLRSMNTSLGTKDFYRLRLGVGRPKRGDVASFVLGRFTPDEEAWLDDLLSKGTALLQGLMRDEPEKLSQEVATGRFPL